MHEQIPILVDDSATDREVVDALTLFRGRLMRLGQGTEEILDAVERWPDEPTLHLAAGFFWLFGQTPDAQSQAGRHLAETKRGERRLNARETAWLRGLELWHRREFDAAAGQFEAITSAYPGDLLALRACEFVYYVLGQQYSGPRFLAHTSRLAPTHADDPNFLAMHAFANELCGDAVAARKHAELAIEQQPVNPWAQHAMEHVLLWEGNPDAAATLMAGWLDQWPHVARTIHCHNAWHLALMYLDRLEDTRAFEIFDTHVWGQTPDLVVEQLDAIAFLWRAEMAGIEVGADRWAAIAPVIRPVCTTLFMPFASAHYAYALARAGDQETLEKLLSTVDDRSSADDGEAERVWLPAGRGIVNGAANLGLGQAREAAEFLEPAMPAMTRIGGSDAQDDLFRFAWLDSLVRAGRKSDALQFLNDRLSRKQPSALEEQYLTKLAT